MYYMAIHRTLCDVLEEMRKCHQTHNYSALPGLIEEAQSMGNRMEAAIGENRDITSVKKEWRKWKKRNKKMMVAKEEESEEKELKVGGTS